MTQSMWEQPTERITAEAVARSEQYAIASVVGFEPYVTAAESQSDLDNRLALLAQPIEASVKDATGGDTCVPLAIEHLSSLTKARWESDRITAAARAIEAETPEPYDKEKAAAERQAWYKTRENVTYTDGTRVAEGDHIRFHQAPGGLMSPGDWQYGVAAHLPESHQGGDTINELHLLGDDGRYYILYGHVIERAEKPKTGAFWNHPSSTDGNSAGTGASSSEWDNMWQQTQQRKKMFDQQRAPQPVNQGGTPDEWKAMQQGVDQQRQQAASLHEAGQPASVSDHKPEPEWDNSVGADLCKTCGWPVSRKVPPGATYGTPVSAPREHDKKNPVEWTDKRKSGVANPQRTKVALDEISDEEFIEAHAMADAGLLDEKTAAEWMEEAASGIHRLMHPDPDQPPGGQVHRDRVLHNQQAQESSDMYADMAHAPHNHLYASKTADASGDAMFPHIAPEQRPYICPKMGADGSTHWRNAQDCPTCKAAEDQYVHDNMQSRQRGPTFVDWLMHGLVPSGAMASVTADGKPVRNTNPELGSMPSKSKGGYFIYRADHTGRGIVQHDRGFEDRDHAYQVMQRMEDEEFSNPLSPHLNPRPNYYLVQQDSSGFGGRVSVNESAQGTERYQAQPTDGKKEPWAVDEWGAPQGAEKPLEGRDVEASRTIADAPDLPPDEKRDYESLTPLGRSMYDDLRHHEGYSHEDALRSGRHSYGSRHTAADFAPGGQADEFSQIRPPTTTHPRVIPKPTPSTTYTMPTDSQTSGYAGMGGEAGGMGDNGTGIGAGELDYTQPTFGQQVAARVATISHKVVEDNPHLSMEQAREIALQAVARHPGMIRSEGGR